MLLRVSVRINSEKSGFLAKSLSFCYDAMS